MAQARLEIKATADITQATRELHKLAIQGVGVIDEIRAKNQEGIKAVIGAFSPLAVAGQAAAGLIGRAFDWMFDLSKRIINAKQAYAELGKEVEKTAKDLNVGTEEAVRLESAAKAAGVSAKKYAEALEDIKRGQTTLEEQASAWERIAGATKTAAAQRETLAGLIANTQQRREDRLGAAERAGAVLSGLGDDAVTAQRLYQQVLNGRTTFFTAEDYSLQAAANGRNGYENPENMEAVLDALNGMIYESLERAQRKQEEATRQAEAEAEAEAAREAARNKQYQRDKAARDAEAQRGLAARDAYARNVYGYAQQLRATGMGDAEIFSAIAKTDGKSADDILLAYYRGQSLHNNSREGVLQRAQAQADAAEANEAKRKAEEKTKADKDKADAAAEAKQRRIADVKEWAKAALAEAQNAYSGGYANGFGLMAGGGDLIGSGRYRAVTRMTEAQKLLQVQEASARVLEQMNEKLNALQEG